MSNPCNECTGEDCVACEVWIERQADNEAVNSQDPCELDFDDEPDYLDEDWDESMDGDFDSAMVSAGFGYDEQYEHDTPLGDYYDDMSEGMEY